MQVRTALKMKAMTSQQEPGEQTDTGHAVKVKTDNSNTVSGEGGGIIVT